MPKTQSLLKAPIFYKLSDGKALTARALVVTLSIKQRFHSTFE